MTFGRRTFLGMVAAGLIGAKPRPPQTSAIVDEKGQSITDQLGAAVTA